MESVKKYLLWVILLLVTCYGCIGNNLSNSPPLANAGPDQTIIDTDRSGSEEIKLDGSGSKDENGTIIGWTWSDNLGDAIPDGPNPAAALSVGTHVITLTVIDNKGAVATDTVKVTVEYPVLHTADSANTGSFTAKNAFDGSTNTFWETGSPFPHWIMTDFGTYPKRVIEYALQTGSHGKDGTDSTGRMPKDWRFEGSNDGSDWTVLDTQADRTDWKVNERRTYTCANPASFRYYRLYITAGVNTKILRLYEVEMME